MFKEFEKQNAAPASGPANLLTVVRELPADLETPVSVYLKLAGQGPSFLLESVTGGEQLARYSFIGINPSQAFVLSGGVLQKRTGLDSPAGAQVEIIPAADPLDALRAELNQHQPVSVAGLPRFSGGLVGYISYDMVRRFEPSLQIEAHASLPEAIFLLADTLIAFDHAFGRLLLVTNVPLTNPADRAAAEAAAEAVAQARLDAIQQRLESASPAPAPRSAAAAVPPSTELRSNMTREQYIQAVLQAKEHIAAGDIFQVVLSQRLERETSASPFSIYRSLRRLNPSPYMYFFDFSGLTDETQTEPLFLIGASPELHVRLEGRQASIRPIAGTRRRGQTPAEDTLLERELLADPKERAEHVMLVDLARNDLGRVCAYGSVRVAEQMNVERYSHVMHIVSHVEGELRSELDAFDLMRATFPAGTVSGSAQDPGHADHSRPGSRAARPVCRGSRLLLL